MLQEAAQREWFRWRELSSAPVILGGVIFVLALALLALVILFANHLNEDKRKSKSSGIPRERTAGLTLETDPWR